MNKIEFCQEMIEVLQSKVGDGMKVSLHTVRKNNNVILQGVIIRKPEQNVSPTIYLERFYEMYQNEMDLEEIADRVLEVYEKGRPKRTIDMEFFKDFDKVKDRIVYRLVNAERNQELLEEIPHILFMDLAICFYYAFWDSELGDGMIMINNMHMNMWETNHKELMNLAEQNTERLFPAEYLTLNSVVEKIYGEECEAAMPNFYLHIMSNSQRCYGAACILYKSELDKIAKRLDSGFYILPSSVHEVIILKDTGHEEVKVLQDMIREVNRTQLEQEEILSDYPYYYDREKKNITRLADF